MANVYQAFCATLQLATEEELSPIELVDEEGGLIARYAQLCQDRLNSVSVELSDEEQASWALERNTWQLFQGLYRERLEPPRRAESPTPVGSTSKNAYSPPLTVFSKVLENSQPLLELSAIRDWLHSISTRHNPAEVRRGYLNQTKHKLKQARRTGANPPRGLVHELDPDAVLRANKEATGNRLDTDDASYERALLRTLFEYVRAGELDLAIDMCRQSDQSWRAASLSGGRLWWDPLLAPEDEGFGEDDLAMDVGEGERRAKGTINRRLWKQMCRKIAASPGLDAYERALYGAISGDAASVLPVCNSWEDQLWTHVNALFEAHVDASLLAADEGRYWSRGSAHKSVGPPPGAADAGDALVGAAGPGGVGVREALEAIFDRVATADRAEVAAAARDPFHVSQTYLIVGKVDELVVTFADRIEQHAVEMDADALAHLLRFFAHLVLVLRKLEQPLPEYAANKILEAYVKVLEANEQDESLIAFYASHLNDSSAIESYARFLQTFGPETDLASRQAALLKAREHGLDLRKIACRTVELILASIREDLPEMSTGSAFDAYAGLSGRELALIRSLEWLVFDRTTYPEALTQANALIRYFLSTDQPHAARALIESLPRDLAPTVAASRTDPALLVREYLDTSALFGCLEKHATWAEAWAMQPRPTAPKLEHAQFKDVIAGLVDEFHLAAVTVLESDWLKLELPEDGSAEGGRRRGELARIRELLVPHLVLRLHHTLVQTKDLIPTNLQRALDLATIVADAKYDLFREFVTSRGNALPEYLEQVRNATLAALDVTRNPFAAI